MAKTISDEKIKLSIVIDGNVAQKELFDLEKATRKLTEENKGLNLQKKLLEKQNKQETDEYKLLTATIKQNTSEITINKAKMAELQKQIGITGLTIKQLQDRALVLKMTLRNVIPGSADYNRYEAELKQVTNRLAELSGKAQTAKLSLAGIADGFNRYQALALSVVATLTGVVFSIQKMIDYNGKLSDAQANVMKTTKMTKEEVDELGKSFGLLETRTSRIDLYKIAEQGGRLGIPKAEIKDFVEEMNVAAVALGDSFTGGVDEVAEKLGKIKFLFKETQDMGIERAYNSIGSAINELGADGVASEANIAEFTKRIGSLTDVLKPSVQETLALGAAFEESGIEAETSSRAYNIFMKQASTESGKFAKVMGISKKAVEDMINTNPLNFMLEFSKGLNGMDATEVAKTLDFLGVNADGANKVVGAMGNNFERFHQSIDLSNKSFDDGTSVINEYNIKNENLAATLEKISKKVSSWFSSEGFTNWLGGAVMWFAKFIGATNDADGTVSNWKNTLAFTAKIIGIVTAALITNAGWQKLVALWTTRNTEATLLYTIAAKARAFAEGVSLIATAAYATVTALLTGNMKQAAISFRMMTAAMMTTPWGFILGALAAIGTAYVMFSKEAKAAATAQSMMADTARQTEALVEKESQTFVGLVAIIQDAAASTEARTAALKKAKEIGGEYVEGLTLENATTAKGKDMIDKYIESLTKKMQLQVLEAKQRELLEQIQERKNKGLKEELSWYEDIWAQTKNFASTGSFGGEVTAAIDKKKEALKELQRQLNLTNAEMKAFLLANPNLIKTIGTKDKSDYIVPTGDDKTGKENKNKSQAEINKERLEAELKFQDEMLRIKRQAEDDEIALMQDGALKQETIENLRYKREIEDLEKQKIHADEMAKLDAQIAKAKQDKDTKYYDFLVSQKKVWGERNQKLDDEINKIEEGKFKTHQLKLGVIQENGAKTAIQKEKEQFDKAKVLRETKFQEQLAALGQNVKAKERLTQEHNKNELDIEQKYLEDLIKKFNDIVGKGHFETIDLDLLSPEQVELFKAEADKLGLTLAELIAKRNELLGKEQTNAQALGIDKSSTDILGFTSDNWNVFFDNLSKGKVGIDEMVFAVGALASAYSMYSDFLTANENAQLKSYERNTNIKKRRLKQQLDAGMINQHQYKVGVEKIDKELDDKKFQIELRQAKRARIIALANIALATAQSIMQIWAHYNGDYGISEGILTALVAVIAGFQIATVLSSPLPSRGAEEGLYPEYIKREQDGKVFKTTGTSSMKTGLYSKPRLLVGEGPGDTPEMVIDKRSYAQLSPATKNALIRELRGVRGFEEGHYNKSGMIQVPTSSPSAPSSNNNDALFQMALTVLERNTAVMERLEENGLLAIVSNKDLKSMKNLDQGIKDYKSLREKAKH